METRNFQPLTIPRLAWNKKTLTGTYGELVAQPLEPGFGITLGNALRRILLGAVEGSAVTSVIIKGINNEFSSIPGVVEDSMQVLLNIKGIVIRNKTGQPGTMRLRSDKEGAVRVADIAADEHLQLVNGDHILAHMAPGGELDIEFFVESGRGYRPAQWPKDKPFQENGKMYLDAMFSSIRKVMFDVEKTRVGKDIDYDKLTLSITTDGSENPVDVMHYAVSVLRTQLEHFLLISEIPFNEISKMPEAQKVEETGTLDKLGLKGIPLDLLLKPIEELELSVRANNCLLTSGIKTVLDLVNLSEDEVLKIKNFGRKSLGEVRDSMKSFGLTFGMNISEEDIKKALSDVKE